MQNQRNPTASNGQLVVIDSKKSRVIDVKKIIWIEAQREYSLIHIADEPDCLVCKNLNKLLRELPREMFFRIHRSSIINRSYIEEFRTGTGRSLIVRLSDDMELNVAWRKSIDFKDAMKDNPGLFRDVQ